MPRPEAPWVLSGLLLASGCRVYDATLLGESKIAVRTPDAGSGSVDSAGSDAPDPDENAGPAADGGGA
jgi:hypothetical protein